MEEVRDLTTHTAVSAVFVSESCIAADVTCTCNIYTIHVVYYVHFRFNFYILLRMLMLSVQYNYTCIILYLHNKLETCYYTMYNYTVIMNIYCWCLVAPIGAPPLLLVSQSQLWPPTLSLTFFDSPSTSAGERSCLAERSVMKGFEDVFFVGF